MVKIKSALSLGLRPSAHVLRLKNPRDGWSLVDHAFAEAFQVIQDEICPECRNPVWQCRSGNNMLVYVTGTDVCQATAALEKAEKDQKKKAPGEFIYVRPKLLFDTPMPTREDYYQELADERAIHEKAKTGTR